MELFQAQCPKNTGVTSLVNKLLIISIKYKIMKTNLIVLLAVLISVAAFAQNGINYKAVIKDGDGNLVVNDLIAVRFTINESTPEGTTVYQEDHAPSTDENGLVIINIGEGNPTVNLFEDIDWAVNAHFLNVQINTGDGLTDMGTTEFKTVPYALSAPDTSKWEDNENGIYRLNGNVGIGTSNPIRKFDVYNEDEDVTALFQNFYAGDQTKYGIYNSLTPAGTSTKYGFYNTVGATNATSSAYGIYNTLSTTGASGNMYGIYSFVAGNGTGSHYALYGYATGAGNYGIYTYNNSADGYAAYFNGYVRATQRLVVGTGVPLDGLTVASKDLYLRNADYTTIRGRYSGSGTGGEIELYMGNKPSPSDSGSGFRTLELQASETANTGSQINLYKADGTLGISLDGDFLGLGRVITQEIEVTGGDLAEFFKVNPGNAHNNQLRPGVLLSIDESNPGDMIMTTEAYDRKIAGIISGANGVKPGLLMSGSLAEEEERASVQANQFPIALAGKVYVYANTENGIIQAGDMLTSSSVPGYAMKVTDYERAQGAIIGKAMTSLESGNGFVLVLVTLK